MMAFDFSILLADLLGCADETALHQVIVRRFVELPGVKIAALVASQPPEWVVTASAGHPAGQLQTELAAEALDSGNVCTAGEWRAVPLDLFKEPNSSPTVLMISGTAEFDWTSLASGISAACSLMRSRRRESRHARRLQALLEITHQWAQTDNTETLLNRMAEAATELFDCDRATIFLWDRPHRTLVGRPALGMENNELRVPDTAGVVGRVVQSGQPERVDRTDDRAVIHSQVDKESGYTTETILCVPLLSPDKETLGAFEVLNKRAGNFTADDLTGLTELAAYAAVSLDNTQQWEQLLVRHQLLVDEAADKVQMIGECPAIEALRSTVAKVAAADLAVLVLGENGTGKEVVAQSLHYRSPRRSEPLIAVNCAALTETLLESELFGHEKGAFTGATESRAGKFEVASGGTLFLDEIGDMSLGGQAKLLRALEQKEVVRVGGHETISTDVRVVAATNQNLAELVREKKFREDLYFRLNVVTLELPPLRERGDDIILLADFFLRQLCQKQGRKPPRLTAAAKKRLVAHRWPGNVRELRNLMERVAYLAAGDKVEAEDLAFTLSPGAASGPGVETGLPLAEATHDFQSDYIRRTIEQVRGNVTEAAKLLGVHRSNLYRKMRALGMEAEED
ncbi:sigma-54-dependent Fis family transcriptional regulator [Aeoliella mucimassa]|uniref:Transcriptional regulatory protein ZraR n=1 Tax=Aeoliella mucimassa TaxID=2527972 RepID=A0A518ANY7_9BACT|nr:sigma-54-dependent Fis family transcriptional regulator [Aeoliella mucimassa]QDU56434.1 Transcriptional regulatory protein ZraR [Aeoliella mucimassa]